MATESRRIKSGTNLHQKALKTLADALSRLDKMDYLNNTNPFNIKIEPTVESLSEN